MDFLLYVPVWLMLIILVVLSIIISFTGFNIIHKYYDYTHLEKYHSVTSYLFNAYGLLYAVLIAFVVFINWSDFNNAQSQFYTESNRISNLFHIVQGFPDPQKSDLMKSIYDYVEVINKTEVPEMSNGNSSYEHNPSYNKLWNDLLSLKEKNFESPLLYDKALDELNKISESRRFRYFYIGNKVPGLIWIVMLAGCVMSFSFSFFFGIKARFPYFFLAVAFTFINIIMLYLIFVLDHPYEGVNAISYDTMEKVQQHIKTVIETR